jgi:hypothetical protein
MCKIYYLDPNHRMCCMLTIGIKNVKILLGCVKRSVLQCIKVKHCHVIKYYNFNFIDPCWCMLRCMVENIQN